MNRVWVAVASMALASALSAPSASAQKKAKAPSKAAAPISAQIAASMGELRWGMSKDELMKKAVRKVKNKYDALIAKTKNAVAEDRLRTQLDQDVEAITKGYVEFDGRTTGWDVSYLRGEFAHNTGEGMLVVRDDNSHNFYFFIDGKFWKWYKAFDAEVFPADNFAAFQTAVERRFGTGKRVRSELKAGEGERQWIEWQDPQSRLRAIDETDFYGFYSLVFEQKTTTQQIAKLRGSTGTDGPKRHALVESVTSERDGHLDSAPDIADRISGHIRERAPAEPSATTSSSAKGKGSAATQPPAREAPSERSAGPKPDDDPLSGLGL